MIETVEFWVIKAMDIDYPRVTILERYDTYDQANTLLLSLDERDREHLTIVSVTPIKRGADA